MAEPAGPAPQRWTLTTLDGCQLAIGRFPRFAYNASGGGALSEPVGPASPSSSIPLHFASEQLRIPPLNWRTTRFLGLPLPPGLSIAITAEQLQGDLNPVDQSVRLQFRARFRFRLAVGVVCLYAAPDLLVHTTLQSGPCQGQRHGACGRPRSADGDTLLVGIARVEPSGDPWLDRFLGLPDEALAELRCRLTTQP
jgi:hypothetical protein